MSETKGAQVCLVLKNGFHLGEYVHQTHIDGGMLKRDRTQLMSIHLALPGPNEQVVSSWAEEEKPTEQALACCLEAVVRHLSNTDILSTLNVHVNYGW